MKKSQELQDWALLLLRIVIGVIFVYHGYLKMGIWQNPTGPVIFKILSIAEPLGGIALILGVFMQWAALGLALVMCGAIYTKFTGGVGFAGQGNTGWEFDLTLLAGNLTLATVGAGRLALAKMMGKK